ncbi:von Willebrand factor type A domain protein [compost metagenome]
MDLLKRFLFIIFIFYGSVSHAQNRNKDMRELNHVVELMNAFSRCSQAWYFDATQLQGALHASSKKLNENYFYCYKTSHKGSIQSSRTEELFRFPEITRNADNSMPAYQLEYVPLLEARETMYRSLERNKKLFGPISPILSKYMAVSDTLFKIHEALNDYITEKTFRSDNEFRQARDILIAHDRWYEEYYILFKQLDKALVDYTNEQYPPLKKHWELQQGLQELNLTMNLLNRWENEAYRENFSNNLKYDSLLHSLNESGLQKDSLYLYNTRGYGYLSSGFWLHTRYRTFYTSMHSTIYWFAPLKGTPDVYIKPSQKHYNDFVRSYNTVVDDYNDYIEIADGLTHTQNSICCLHPSEIDTTQNVLLKAPRLPYKFEYEEKKPDEVIPEPIPENLSSDELLIRKAQPHHLVYLLDASSSMNESGKLTHLKEHANKLVQLQREVDHISVVTFSGRSEVLLQSVPCDQKKHIEEKISRIHAFGQTNIKSGLQTVKNLLSSTKLENGVNSVLLLTDGEFPLSDETRMLLNELKTDGIVIYFVYLGKPLGRKSSKAFQKTYSDLGVILYDTNKIDLKEALLKIATE